MSTDRLEKGDTVLVTGATGLIGAWTVNELLSRGFKVRGATRDVNKTTLLQAKLDGMYGPGQVEFVQIDDAYKTDAYLSALQGTAGIIHLAVDLGTIFNPDASLDDAIRTSIDFMLGILKTATKVPSIKSAVITSSNAALYNIEYGKDIEVSLEDYNEKAVHNALTVPKDHPFRATYIYSAAKARSEQGLWQWVKEAKPHFSVNTVIPHTNVGPIFNPAPGVYTTSTWLREFFDGNVNAPVVAYLAPGNWFVDVRDCATIHVAALIDAGITNQRLWAAGQPPVHVNEILKIWRAEFPNHPVPADFDTPTQPMQHLDREASTNLLRKHAGRDWQPFRTSLIDNVKEHAKVW